MTYCESLDEFLCAKVEIWLKTLENIRKSVNFLERGRFSQKLIIRFSLNSPDCKIGTRVTHCESVDEFLCAKVEIWLKTLENIRKSVNFLERGRFSQKLIIRFSLNSPDSKIGTRVTYCESLDEFLFAKVEIWLKTQENIRKSVNFLERSGFSQKWIIRLFWNFPDS